MRTTTYVFMEKQEKNTVDPPYYLELCCSRPELFKKVYFRILIVLPVFCFIKTWIA